MSGIKECPKEKGALLYSLATKGKNLSKEAMPHFVKMIADGKWTRVAQLDAGVEYMKEKIKNVGKDFVLKEEDIASFESATGVGIHITQEQID